MKLLPLTQKRCKVEGHELEFEEVGVCVSRPRGDKRLQSEDLTVAT